MREQLRFFSGLINWTGFSIGFIEVSRSDRYDGKTTYTLKKRLQLATNAIIAYSDKPLRVSIKLGFLISCCALLFGLFLFCRALFNHVPVAGWSSLIISIYFLAGIIIANLGIIGIYLGKTFEEVKRRPLYIIKENTLSESNYLPTRSEHPFLAEV
jgi:dolichol-phosphate mannosyltransferase